MNIFKLENCNVCDEIRYDLSQDVLESVEFFLKEKNVLKKLEEKLSGVLLESIFKNETKIVSSAPFLKEFIEKLKIDKKNIAIKSAIQNFHKGG